MKKAKSTQRAPDYPEPELVKKYAKWNNTWAAAQIRNKYGPGGAAPFEGELCEQVFQRIKMHEGVTFAELEKTFPEEFKGDYCLSLPGYDTMVMWINMSEAMTDAIAYLIRSKLVTVSSTSHMTYLIDGAFLKMPIARKAYNYKDPHWVPVTFSTNLPKEGTA